MDRSFFTFLFLCFIHGRFASKLVVILMDGFRWDYFDHVAMPGFAKMAKDGVKVEYLQPDYPTLSYPNYYSVMTGLHCESHGMVGNYMYDINQNKSFLIGTNPDQSLPLWWDDAEPVWVTAEKMGKKSFFYYWPGCEVTIRGVKPTYCKYYELSLVPQFEYSLQQATALVKNNSADLIGIYLEAPDYYGHKFGVKSQNLTQVLKEIDDSLARYRQNLTALGLDDDVNIMIFSDHGMTNVTKTVNITNAFDLADIKVLLPEVPYVSIWPMEGKLDKVYNDLISANKANITVYKKEFIPDRYFLKRHPRTAPIIIEADPGVIISAPWICSECKNKTFSSYEGMHGYDNLNQDMRGIFRAVGPAFRANFTNKGIASIELYQIMCRILGLKPNAHNGTWSNVADMMTKDGTSSGKKNEISTLTILTISFATMFTLSLSYPW